MDCREGGIVEEYQLDNAVNNPELVPELFSVELLTLCLAEPGLTLLQNSWLVAVATENGTAGASITAGIIENQQSQRRCVAKDLPYRQHKSSQLKALAHR